LLAYPGLQVQVEGHTDSVGSDEYNQTLSDQRAATVRDFLTQQGVQPGSISSRGFGKTQPIASNDTATGRQLNRRVDMIVSGESVIGTTTTTTITPGQSQTSAGQGVSQPGSTGQPMQSSPAPAGTTSPQNSTPVQTTPTNPQ
jgi:hypothetical protein